MANNNIILYLNNYYNWVIYIEIKEILNKLKVITNNV